MDENYLAWFKVTLGKAMEADGTLEHWTGIMFKDRSFLNKQDIKMATMNDDTDLYYKGVKLQSYKSYMEELK